MRDCMTVIRALADENRVRVLMALRRGELCVCQIIAMLGLAPSTVSKHMSILKNARLVDSRKDGRWVYYRLADKCCGSIESDAVQWINRCLTDDPAVAADTQRLDEILASVCPGA